jgi:hypothetical protein
MAKRRNTSSYRRRGGERRYLPSMRTREFLRARMRKRPEQVRKEIECAATTEKRLARQRYLRRLLASQRPDKLREWYGPRQSGAAVTTRQMTDEERARYFPVGVR